MAQGIAAWLPMGLRGMEVLPFPVACCDSNPEAHRGTELPTLSGSVEQALSPGVWDPAEHWLQEHSLNGHPSMEFPLGGTDAAVV